MFKYLIFLFLTWPTAFTYATSDAIFQTNEHCAAWKTRKTMFLFKQLEPVGINCNIQTKMLQTEKGLQLQASFPIKSFNSGEPDRDAAVFDILQGKLQEDLTYLSRPLTVESLQGSEGKLDIQGTLTLGGKTYPLTFTTHYQKKDTQISFHGLAKTSYTALGIEPPKVLGGLVANVHDTLELHFLFQSNKIQDFPAPQNK
ncbi:MAG: YceI family protein [Zetaproteobacteria bacterium]|nr:YceI family protein [Zetaproteobacteria bacterium]